MRATKVMRSAANSSFVVAREAEQVLRRLGDLPLHGPLDRGGVQVAGEHQGLVVLVPLGVDRHLSARDVAPKGSRRPCSSTLTFITWSIMRHLEVQPGHGRGVVLAEPQHDRLLVRLDGVGRVEDHPSRSTGPDGPGDQRDEPLPGLARAARVAGPGVRIPRRIPCVEKFSWNHGNDISGSHRARPFMPSPVLGRGCPSGRVRASVIAGWRDRTLSPASRPGRGFWGSESGVAADSVDVSHRNSNQASGFHEGFGNA